VHEAVDHRGGGELVTEDLAPRAERRVGGDHQAGALVAAGEEHESGRNLRDGRSIPTTHSPRSSKTVVSTRVGVNFVVLGPDGRAARTSNELDRLPTPR
jgi:hypothetical protein